MCCGPGGRGVIELRRSGSLAGNRHTYRIVPSQDFPLGNVRNDGDSLVIELSPTIPQNRVATILIWEMANAYQRESFTQIAQKAKEGEIRSHREFAIRMEIVEHGSHHLHREVLSELASAGVRISRDHLFFLGRHLSALEDYQIPSAHAYLEAQAKNGHMRHYEKWFYLVKGERAPAEYDHVK